MAGREYISNAAQIRQNALDSITLESLQDRTPQTEVPLTKTGQVKRSGFTEAESLGIAQNVGITPPRPTSEGLLPSLFGMLSAVNYAVAGAAEEIWNPSRGTGSIVGRVWGELSEIPRLGAGLIGLGWKGSEFAQKEGFSAVMEQGGIGPGGSISSLLPFMFNKDGAGWKLQEGGVGDITTRGFAGFALDVFTDPLSYVTGVGAISKGSQKVSRAGASALRKAGVDVPKKGLLLTKQAKKDVNAMAHRMLDNITRMRRARGMGPFVNQTSRNAGHLNRRGVIPSSAQLADAGSLTEALAAGEILIHNAAELRIINKMMKMTGMTQKEAAKLYRFRKHHSIGVRNASEGAGKAYLDSLEAIAYRAAEIRVVTGRAGTQMAGALSGVGALSDVERATRKMRGLAFMGKPIPGTAAVSTGIGKGLGTVFSPLRKGSKNMLQWTTQWDGFIGSLASGMITLPGAVNKIFRRYPNLRKHPEAIQIAQEARDIERFRVRESAKMLRDYFEDPFRPTSFTPKAIRESIKTKNAVHEAIIRHIDNPKKYPITKIPERYRHLVSYHKAITNDLLARELRYQVINPKKVAKNYHPRPHGFWRNSDEELAAALGNVSDEGSKVGDALLANKTLGTHNEERIFSTIDEGEKAGLIPRFNISENLMARMSAHHRAIGGNEMANAMRLRFGKDHGIDMARMWMHNGLGVTAFVKHHLFGKADDADTPRVIDLEGEFVSGVDVRADFARNIRMIDPRELDELSDYSYSVSQGVRHTQAEIDAMKWRANTVGFNKPLRIMFNKDANMTWVDPKDEMMLKLALEGKAREIPIEVIPVQGHTRPGAKRVATPGGPKFDSARRVVGPSAVKNMSNDEFKLLNAMLFSKEGHGVKMDENFAKLSTVGKSLFLHQKIQKIKNLPDMERFLKRHRKHFEDVDSESFNKIMNQVAEYDYAKSFRREGWVQIGGKQLENMAKKMPGGRVLPSGRVIAPKAIDKLKGIWLPKGVVDEIMDKDNFVFPKDVVPVFQVVDTLNNIFKMGVTLPWPAFHIRNAYSNTMQSFLDIGFSAMNPVKRAQNWKIWRGDDGVLTREFGGAIPYQSILDMAKRLGILTHHGDLIELSARPASHQFRRRGLFNRTGKGLRKVAGTIENDARMTHFVEGLRNGLDFQEAAERTKKFLFDYGNLNKHERAFFARVIPFWQWTKFNIPLQIESVAKRPGRVAALAKPFGARSEQLDYELLPDYLRGDMSATVSTGRNANGETRTFLYGIDAPFSDLERLDFTRPLEESVRGNLAMVTPLLKGVWELGTQTNLLSGKSLSPKIGGFAGDTVNALPSPIKNWLGVAEFTDLNGDSRIVMNPTASYLLFRGFAMSRLIRAGETFDEARTNQEKRDAGETVMGDTLDSWALQFLTGVRTREYNLDARTKARMRERSKAMEKFLIDRGVIASFTRGFITEEEFDSIYVDNSAVPSATFYGRYK
jgi:hypothetical protein